jgi:hypothetical protein
MKVENMKNTPAKTILFFTVAMLASCATLPTPEVARTSVYRNRHDIQFEYPSTWILEDMSKKYGSFAEAEMEGASYIQVYSYDPIQAGNPTEAVSPSQIKIAIILSKRQDGLDYPKVLARIADGRSENVVFRINGKDAYELRYRVMNEETGGTLDILSIEYLDQGLYARFICYPSNSMHVRAFEALVKSFRYKGE